MSRLHVDAWIIIEDMMILHTSPEPFTRRVNDLMNRIYIELDKISLNNISDEDYPKCAAKIMFALGYEYYSSAWLTLTNGQVHGGANLIRASLENLADAIHASRRVRRSKKYIRVGRDTFLPALRAAEGKPLEEVVNEELLKHVNDWSDAGLDIRIKNLGDRASVLYDFLCYFSHPNPGTSFFLAEGGKIARQKLNSQLLHDLHTISLSLARLVSVQCDLEVAIIEEVDSLAAEIQAKLYSAEL